MYHNPDKYIRNITVSSYRSQQRVFYYKEDGTQICALLCTDVAINHKEFTASNKYEIANLNQKNDLTYTIRLYHPSA